MKKTMKKQTKKPAAKTVARPLVPAVPLPPPDHATPADPEEARINREAAAAVIEGRRHQRRADDLRLAGGVPYTGKDERLAGSTFHDRDALIAFGALADEEEKEVERCVERARRAYEDWKDLHARKALDANTAALREHTAALRASNPPPPSSPDENAVRNHDNDPGLVACVSEWKRRKWIVFCDGKRYDLTGEKQWKDIDRLIHPTDPAGWVQMPTRWHWQPGGDSKTDAAAFGARIQPEGRRRSGTGRFRLT